MSHCTIIDKNFDVWAFGNNESGQLGLGHKEDRSLPTKIPGLPPIISTAGNDNHTIFLDDNGFIWISGISDSKLIESSIPIKVNGVKNIVKISSGEDHVLLLDNDGNVLSFGDNECAELGLGNQVGNIGVPTKIENIPQIKDICCGNFRSVLIDVNGNCWTFGENSSGELGLGDKINRNVPTKIDTVKNIISASAGLNHTIMIDVSGTVYITGVMCAENSTYQGALVPAELCGLPEIKLSYSSNQYSMFIDIDDNVWGFGYNDYGQLGLNDRSCQLVYTPRKCEFFERNVHSAKCFGNSSIIIDFDGRCFSFGENTVGQLGLGTKSVKEISPTKIEGLIANIENKRFRTTKNARKS